MYVYMICLQQIQHQIQHQDQLVRLHHVQQEIQHPIQLQTLHVCDVTSINIYFFYFSELVSQMHIGYFE